VFAAVVGNKMAMDVKKSVAVAIVSIRLMSVVVTSLRERQNNVCVAPYKLRFPFTWLPSVTPM
jgi:hypothetical protein